MTSRLYVVVGGQYGSEGKGAVAARIASDERLLGRGVVGVRVGGPNAGHTAMGKCPPGCTEAHPEAFLRSKTPHPWRLRQVPVAAVTDQTATLVIAAGSEIDPDVLADEVRQLDAAGYEVSARLHVDYSATVLTAAHIRREADNKLSERLGSTAKGIGAARSARIWRQAETWGQTAGRLFGNLGVPAVDTQQMLAELLRRPRTSVIVEGTQGYGLGLHTRQYPYVTSGDCRAVDFLAQAGISPWQAGANGDPMRMKVVIAIRPHPIRVAGNSGALKGETSWQNLGLPEERTTVTQKIRRVGMWDSGLAQDSIRANGGPRGGVVWVALTMWDTVCRELAGQDGMRDGWTAKSGSKLLHSLHPYLKGMGVEHEHVGYVGTGPGTALVNQDLYE